MSPGADPGGSWGVVTDPYVPPERGPEFTMPRCGCVTFGEGAPSDDSGDSGDVYVDSLTKIIYQKEGDSWVIIGTGGGGEQQLYESNGDPNGVITATTAKVCYCIDTLNHIGWIKDDGLLTNTGWHAP